MNSNHLSAIERDAIGEILNISLGASATAISNMLDQRVEITTPTVTEMTKEELAFDHLDPAIGVGIEYVEGLTGSNVLLLKQEDVRIMVSLLMHREISAEEFELDEMTISATCEVMNQMMGSSATALSNLLERPVNISIPQPFSAPEVDYYKEHYLLGIDDLVVVNFDLQVDGYMKSEFVNIIPLEMAKELVSGFLSHLPAEQESEAQETAKPIAAEPPVAEAVAPEPVISDSPVPEAAKAAPQESEVLSAMYEMMKLMEAGMNLREQKQIKADAITRPNLRMGNTMITTGEQEENMELIMGVPMEVSVEIGRTKKMVKDILDLNKGSLVVLDKLTGEPVDLYVNGQCIAKGDVVVVEDNFGVRITEILSKEINYV